MLHESGDRGRQILPRFALHDISLNADFLRLFHELTALVHGEDEDGCMWSECVDSTGRVEAVHQRHRDIENDQVGDGFFDLFDCFETIRGFVTNIEVISEASVRHTRLRMPG